MDEIIELIYKEEHADYTDYDQLDNTVERLLEDVKQKQLKKNKNEEKPEDKNKVFKVLSIIKDLHRMTDEEIIEGKFLPKLRVALTQVASITGLSLLNPSLGVLYFLVNGAIRKVTKPAKLRRILNSLETELAFVERRLDKEENDKEVYKLMKMKSSLKQSISRIKLREKNLT